MQEPAVINEDDSFFETNAGKQAIGAARQRALAKMWEELDVSYIANRARVIDEWEQSIRDDIQHRSQHFADALAYVREHEAAGNAFVGLIKAPTHPHGNRAARRAAKKAGRA
jgi:hypothetical protein